MQAGAGLPSSFRDEYYKNAGADVTTDLASVYGADVVIKVRPPSLKTDAVPGGSEVGMLKPGARLISYVQPAQHPDLLESLVKQGTTAFAMDQVRISSVGQALRRHAIACLSCCRFLAFPGPKYLTPSRPCPLSRVIAPS